MGSDCTKYERLPDDFVGDSLAEDFVPMEFGHVLDAEDNEPVVTGDHLGVGEHPRCGILQVPGQGVLVVRVTAPAIAVVVSTNFHLTTVASPNIASANAGCL